MSEKSSVLKNKVSGLFRGDKAGYICLASAALFAVFAVWLRREYLLWRHLPLVAVLAIACGACFAVIPVVMCARAKEGRALRAFIGAFAFFQTVLWALLTSINVGGGYNRRAAGFGFFAVSAVFAGLCCAAFVKLSRDGKKAPRRAAAVILCVCFSIGALLSVFQIDSQNFDVTFDTLIHGGEKAFFENWSARQPFERSYAVELEKEPDRDFVVLNLTDIQLTESEAMGEVGEQVKNNTDRLVAQVEPDLITLSGDNAWSANAYLHLIGMIDAYGIPWAPVMGNHDGQGCPSEFWCAYKFAHAKNCLFKFGPADMGYGNYIINITQNGGIIHTLFMMDTHSDIEEDNINGPADGSNYDHLWQNQFDWYSWAVDGIAAEAGGTVESTVIFHIPLYEYKTAWETATGADWETDRDAPYVGEYARTSIGARREYGGWPPQSNGFFDLIKEKGSTKNVVCGHDHTDDYSIVYEGIRLTYAVKDGPGCYWEPEVNGGTLISVGGDGHATVQHRYIDFYGS